MKTLEKQLIADAAAFDKVEPPRGFRSELSKTIRYLPPPSAPRRPLAFPGLRIGLASAAALLLAALALNYGHRDAADPGASHASPGMMVTAPDAGPVTKGEPLAATSALPPGAAWIGSEGDALRSDFVDEKLEQEWNYLKEDAKTFSSPFRSAIPAIYRHR